MSDATYTMGPPKRPNITHDNGFLDKFTKRAPTPDDTQRLSRWKRTLFLAEAAQGLPLASDSGVLLLYLHSR